MTIIGAGHDFPGETYKKLVSDDRWNELIEMFRIENAKIFSVSIVLSKMIFQYFFRFLSNLLSQFVFN